MAPPIEADIVELDENGEKKVPVDIPLENSAASKGIEADEDELDVTDQIVFLYEAMNAREKRKTFDKLRPVLEPLLSSTHLGKSELSDSSINDDTLTNAKPAQSETLKEDQPTLITSGGNVTLSTGTSRVVIQTGSGNFVSKLKSFSGIVPVPSGQVDFRTWLTAAYRLQRNDEISSSEKLSRIQNSLLKPSLDIVQKELDSGSVTSVLKLLEAVYGSVEDPRDLLNNFNATCQSVKENPSDYLSRLYLLLDELQRHAVVEVRDAPSMLIKQFLYGCYDDNIMLKLRLEDHEQDPPDYGKLLLAIRREEAKRTRRQLVAKRVASQQVQAEREDEVEKLREEVKNLKVRKSEFTSTQSSSEVDKLRNEVAQLRQQVAGSDLRSSPSNSSHQASKPDSKQTPSKPRNKLRFCFKCGLDGHTVWKCTNEPNVKLVCTRFEKAKTQEN